MRFIGLLCLLTTPLIAEAYVGSGIGIGAITSLIAFIAALFTSVWGLVWQPIKNYRQKKKAASEEPPADTND